MLDRIPQYPNRMLVTPEGGGSQYYAVITRADDPTTVGTPLNKATLLASTTAAKLGLDDATGTVSQALAGITTDYTATLNEAAWSGTAPYTQTISINGILESDNPIMSVVLSSDASTAASEIRNFGYVGMAETGNNTLTVTCFKARPSINLNIQLKVVR